MPGEDPEKDPLLVGFKAGFDLSSTWSSVSELTTSITSSMNIQHQKLLAAALSSKPDIDPMLSLQFPLSAKDVEIIRAKGHNYVQIADVLKPYPKSDAWSLLGTPDYIPPALSGHNSDCWLVDLYNSIEALPAEKANHKQHLRTHLFEPYCDAHLRARVEQLLVYPLPHANLRLAVIELNGLAEILTDGDIKFRLEYIVEAFKHAITYFESEDVLVIARVDYKEGHKEDHVFPLNEKLQHIQNSYNSELISILNQVIKEAPIDKKMKQVDELSSPQFNVDKKTKSLLSKNNDYILASAIDDELDGLFNKSPVVQNIDSIIQKTTQLQVVSCKSNMFRRIEKFRDASCEKFLEDLRKVESADQLKEFYATHVESKLALQHMDLEKGLCDRHGLVHYQFWSNIKSVLIFLSKPEDLEANCDELYKKLDAIHSYMGVFLSDPEKKEKDFSLKVKEFFSRKIKELYIAPRKVELLEKLKKKKEDLQNILPLTERQEALREFKESIQYEQCSQRLLRQDQPCIAENHALSVLIAEKERAYDAMLSVAYPVSDEAIATICASGVPCYIAVANKLGAHLLKMQNPSLSQCVDRKSSSYLIFYSQKFSSFSLVEFYNAIENIPEVDKKQKENFENIFMYYFAEYLRGLLTEAIAYPLNLRLLILARDKLSRLQNKSGNRFNKHANQDMKNGLQALGNAIDYISNNRMVLETIPLETNGVGYVLDINRLLIDVEGKYKEESIRKLEELEGPWSLLVPVESYSVKPLSSTVSQRPHGKRKKASAITEHPVKLTNNNTPESSSELIQLLESHVNSTTVEPNASQLNRDTAPELMPCRVNKSLRRKRADKTQQESLIDSLDLHEKKIRQHIQANCDYKLFCTVHDYLGNHDHHRENMSNMVAEAKKIENKKCREKIFKKIEDIRNESKKSFIDALRAIHDFSGLLAFQDRIATDWAPYLGLNEEECGRDLEFYSFWQKIQNIVERLSSKNDLLDAQDATHYDAICRMIDEIEVPNVILRLILNDSIKHTFHREVKTLLQEKMQNLYTPRFQALCFTKLDEASSAIEKEISFPKRNNIFYQHKIAIESDPRFTACLSLPIYQKKIEELNKLLLEPPHEQKKQIADEENKLNPQVYQLVPPLRCISSHETGNGFNDSLVGDPAEDSAVWKAYQLRFSSPSMSRPINSPPCDTIEKIVNDIKTDTECVRFISFCCLLIPLWGKVKTVQDLEDVIDKANGGRPNPFSWLWGIFCSCLSFFEKVTVEEDVNDIKMPTAEDLLLALGNRHSRKYDGFGGFRTQATKDKLADWERRLQELQTSCSKSPAV